MGRRPARGWTTDDGKRLQPDRRGAGGSARRGCYYSLGNKGVEPWEEKLQMSERTTAARRKAGLMVHIKRALLSCPEKVLGEGSVKEDERERIPHVVLEVFYSKNKQRFDLTKTFLSICKKFVSTL